MSNIEEKSFSKTSINRDMGILGETYSNHWRYWFFDVEILIYEDKDGITKVNVTFTDEEFSQR